MAQRYINIGNSCTQLDFAGRPSNLVLQNVYILNQSNIPLKNSGFTASGFPAGTSVTSNILNYSDYEFKIWFSEDLIFSASNKSYWRYLSDNSTNSVPLPPAASSDNITIKPNAANTNFPDQATFEGSGYTFSVNHIASSSTVFTLVNQTSSTLQTQLSALLSLPTSSPIYIGNAGGEYLKYDATGFSKVLVTNNLAVNVNTDISVFYFIKLKIGNSLQLGLGTSAAAANFIPGCYVDSSRNIIITGISGIFTHTTTQPASVTPAGFPTAPTLFRLSSNNKYLYWGGGSTFTLKNYWTDGLSASQIQQGMQFWLQDMTAGIGNSDAVPSQSLSDFYKWMVVNNTAVAPNSIGNTSNVVSNQSNTLTVTSTTYLPTNNEGWVLNGLNNNCRLVYVKPVSGALTPVGYLTNSSSDNISFIISSNWPIDSTSNSFQCLKCTVAASGYCDVSSGGAAVTVKTVGSITATKTGTYTISVSVAGSTLSPGDPIVVSVNNGSFALTTPPTSWTGSSYSLTTTNPLIDGTSYTIVITSTGATSSTGGTFVSNSNSNFSNIIGVASPFALLVTDNYIYVSDGQNVRINRYPLTGGSTPDTTGGWRTSSWGISPRYFAINSSNIYAIGSSIMSRFNINDGTDNNGNGWINPIRFSTGCSYLSVTNNFIYVLFNTGGYISRFRLNDGGFDNSGGWSNVVSANQSSISVTDNYIYVGGGTSPNGYVNRYPLTGGSTPDTTGIWTNITGMSFNVENIAIDGSYIYVSGGYGPLPGKGYINRYSLSTGAPDVSGGWSNITINAITNTSTFSGLFIKGGFIYVSYGNSPSTSIVTRFRKDTGELAVT